MAEIGDLSEIGGEITLEWKIKDFSSQSDERDIFYCSPKFYFSNASWNLQMFPNGQTEYKTEGFIALYLMKRSSDSPITLNYTLGLKTVDGKKESKENYKNVFHDKNEGYGYRKLISRSVLLDKKSELLPSDMLTLTCTIKNSEPKDVIESYFHRLQDVSDTLKEIYHKGEKTDFTLKVGNESIRAHHMILQRRSPVFAAMLNQDTREKQTGEVSIEDLDKSAVDSLLGYIYSGDIDNLTTENVLSIYAAADKYDIKNVKGVCVKFILHNLSAEWVCDIIKFADLYNEEEVGRCARKCFTENADEILESDKWKSFIRENPLMGVELLSSIVKYLLPKTEKDK